MPGAPPLGPDGAGGDPEGALGERDIREWRRFQHDCTHRAGAPALRYCGGAPSRGLSTSETKE